MIFLNRDSILSGRWVEESVTGWIIILLVLITHRSISDGACMRLPPWQG